MARFRIREIAESKGITTATELMRRTGIGFNLAREIWKGTDLNLEIRTLEKIATELGVQVVDLFVPSSGN